MPRSASDYPGPMPRRRIYLVRHGDVTYFDGQGRPFPPGTVQLNPDGRRQAEAAARELAAIPLDRVVASDLVRTTETAKILIAGRGLTLETRPQLREIQPGRLADLPPDEAVKAFLGAFPREFDRTARFLGGETFGSLADRVLACFHEVLNDASWRQLLIVAHGGVNRVLLANALDSGMRGFGVFEQDPGCLNVLDVADDGRFLIRLVNYTPYNTVKVGLELTTMETLYQQYRAGAGAAR
jgi:broad specificity phosphatase PhoE